MTIDDSSLAELTKLVQKRKNIEADIRCHRRKQNICLFLFIILILGLFGNSIWEYWSGVWDNWEWPIYSEGSAGSDFFKWSAKWFK